MKHILRRGRVLDAGTVISASFLVMEGCLFCAYIGGRDSEWMSVWCSDDDDDDDGRRVG